MVNALAVRRNSPRRERTRPQQQQVTVLNEQQLLKGLAILAHAKTLVLRVEQSGQTARGPFSRLVVVATASRKQGKRISYQTQRGRQLCAGTWNPELAKTLNGDNSKLAQRLARIERGATSEPATGTEIALIETIRVFNDKGVLCRAELRRRSS